MFASTEPLWAFGHGLSYTNFDYLNAVVDKELYKAHDTIRVTSDIEKLRKTNG